MEWEEFCKPSERQLQHLSIERYHICGTKHHHLWQPLVVMENVKSLLLGWKEFCELMERYLICL